MLVGNHSRSIMKRHMLHNEIKNMQCQKRKNNKIADVVVKFCAQEDKKFKEKTDVKWNKGQDPTLLSI